VDDSVGVQVRDAAQQLVHEVPRVGVREWLRRLDDAVQVGVEQFLWQAKNQKGEEKKEKGRGCWIAGLRGTVAIIFCSDGKATLFMQTMVNRGHLLRRSEPKTNGEPKTNERAVHFRAHRFKECSIARLNETISGASL